LDTNANRIDGLSTRTAHFRKAYARGLGRKATTLEAAAIERAARLTALAEHALVDPNVSINDRVRLDGCAAKARRDMAAVLAKPVSKPGTDALRDYLASKQAASA
jgi:hypothetical protein